MADHDTTSTPRTAPGVSAPTPPPALAPLTELKLDDFTEAAPIFLIIAGIPLSFSIAEGIGLGLITYAALKLVTGRVRDTSALTYVLAAIFSLHLIRAIFAHLF